MHITKHLHGKTHDRSKVNVGSSIARRQRPEESLVCARVTAGEIPSSFGRVCRTSPSAVWLTLSRFSLRNLTHSFSHSLTHTQTHTLPIHFVLPSPFLTFPLSSFPSSISHSHSFIFPMVYNCSLSLSFSCLPSLFLPFILFPSPSFLPLLRRLFANRPGVRGSARSWKPASLSMIPRSCSIREHDFLECGKGLLRMRDEKSGKKIESCLRPETGKVVG